MDEQAHLELDARVAREVMGWKRMSWRDYHALERAAGRFNGTDDRETPTYAWHNQDGSIANGRAEASDDYYSQVEAWSPSFEIADAWEVAEATAKRTGWRFSVWQEVSGHWAACFGSGFDRNAHLEALGDTAPLAICLAALKAVASICTWHGPEGEACAAPWTTERTGHRLCERHAALVEMLEEPPSDPARSIREFADTIRENSRKPLPDA